MSRLRRPASWYASWMNFSDDANSEVAITNRRKEADELVHNIRDGHFDAHTLDELTQVLDHEIFFLETTERAINQQRRNSNALMLPWTGKLVTELSRCLFQTIYPESYYERELQFRALLSTLVLQRAQGTEALEYEHHDALWKQFQKGYKNLQWQKPSTGDFTKETFRKFQCSYMLVSISEYAKNFKREEPVIVELLLRTSRLLIAGGSMAMSATAGTGGGGVQSIIQVLNDSFKPLCRAPAARYNDFFVLQELTRIASAFKLRSNVLETADINNSQLISSNVGRLSDLATSILDRILVLLNNDSIEEKISQPTTAWRNFLAFTDRGPPSFNDFYYLYGLLDCATQLGRIIDRNDISVPFEERVRRIVKNCKDSSIRWKAIEFLVSTDLWKDDEDSIIPDEAKVIRLCLDEETNVPRPPSLSPSRRLSSPSQVEIQSAEWMESEAHYPPFEMTTARDCPRIILPKGVFESNDCYSAGLSPNCELAYFLREKDILIYSLNDYPKVTEKNIIHKRTPSIDEDYKDTRAVLTDRFLAVLSRGRSHRLSICEHGSRKGQVLEVGSQIFDMWYPTCISMFEASNRTWVAIGGHSNRDGRIRLYRIENSHGKLSLRKHDAQFEISQPNALHNDWPKVINFSPDGRRLVCVTKNKNKVLVWFLSDNARPRQAPFEIMKSYEAGTTARGIDSASLFYSPSKRPYIFCTTVPSDRRHENGGEWPFISPVHLCPATVPEQLEHAFFGLRKSAPMLAGAVSADGRVAAMLESSGTLILHALRPSENGGICPSGEPVVFKKALGKHNNALLSNTTLRFHFREDNKQLNLSAVDIEGRIFRSRFLSS